MDGRRQNLVALVSTDAEFDHFEAVREPYAASLGTFISAAAKANLAALQKLTAAARTAPAQNCLRSSAQRWKIPTVRRQ